VATSRRGGRGGRGRRQDVPVRQGRRQDALRAIKNNKRPGGAGSLGL